MPLEKRDRPADECPMPGLEVEEAMGA